MIKRNILVGLCVFFLGLSTSTYAADTEVVLDTDDSTSGFTVSDSDNQALMRVGGDGVINLRDPGSLGGDLLTVSDNPGNIFQKITRTITAGGGFEFQTRHRSFPNYNTPLRIDTTLVDFPEGRILIRGANRQGIAFGSNRAGYIHQFTNDADQTFRFRADMVNHSPTWPTKVWDINTDKLNPTDRKFTSFLPFEISEVSGQDSTLFKIQDSASNNLVLIDNIGNLTIAGTLTQSSSRELKKEIAYISTKDAMETLKDLNPVRFKYKADNSGDEHVGFIAEDVPELVATQDRKGLSPMDITAVLTKVVQEQQTMLKEQQEVISALSAKVKSLEDRI
jgi:hypothetical protein